MIGDFGSGLDRDGGSDFGVTLVVHDVSEVKYIQC
jgi:hypothetical protein